MALHGAELIETNLERAKLNGTDLGGAKLERVRLTGAEYNEATKWPPGFQPDNEASIRFDQVISAWS